MIGDTTDLPSYYPGYDEYCEPKIEELEDDREFYENYILEMENKKMERKIIDLKTVNLTNEEIGKLENYVWKQDKLIPEELVYGQSKTNK